MENKNNLEQSKYCYKNSDTLINKFDILDNMELSKVERSLVLFRLTEMHLNNKLEFGFKIDNYLEIHRYLFQDLYHFAGKIRDEEISKGTTLFCLKKYIYSNLKDTLLEMKKESNKVNKYESLIEYLAYYYSYINIIHPFREGNGRTLREYLRQNVFYLNDINNLNFELDYSLVNEKVRKYLMDGSILSSLTGDIKVLKYFFESVLKEKDKQLIK